MIDTLRADARKFDVEHGGEWSGDIALIGGSELPDSIVQTLQTALPFRIVTYSAVSQFRDVRDERVPILIVLGEEVATGSNRETIEFLSELPAGVPVVVLVTRDDQDLARVLISVGAKAYIPVQTGYGVAVSIIRYILAHGAR
jgi:DNA-binding NarL/FixJ family response regulator